MAQQDYRYEGTTFLLVGVQAIGWLGVAGGAFMFFRTAFDPLAIPLGIGGVAGGLLTVALGSVGRIFVSLAEDIQNHLPGLMANQALQVVTTQALLETARANVK